ncbi:DUF2461 domain-containing protein [Kordiimonas laminariae]|uniref:DUF2461 domain-containing protein n=1 Tax=Kordiimonas laminariae TaxID=2917717 RepID=UPI001FF3561D|nr:DUF2461 domain-containing protein [Kordiimonas laminariae]MCK0069228.1 DUF2461 domain-containing protein [Kordiimonas laminariae]
MAGWHFDPETIVFLNDLKANNTKDWFTENKARFTADYKEPADFFKNIMQHQLEDAFGESYNAKIFRIYRDLRFSKDKTPYNTHLHISFVPSGLKSLAWYFGLQAENLVLGTGVFGFEKDRLNNFRETIVSKKGDQLADILADLQENGFRIGKPDLKKIPRGFDANHPNAYLLRYKGLTVWRDFADTTPATSGDLIALCTKTYREMKPFFDWMQSFYQSS